MNYTIKINGVVHETLERHNFSQAVYMCSLIEKKFENVNFKLELINEDGFCVYSMTNRVIRAKRTAKSI